RASSAVRLRKSEGGFVEYPSSSASRTLFPECAMHSGFHATKQLFQKGRRLAKSVIALTFRKRTF
ncbi:MAG TPA: hypothetical protein PK216_03530, partial [Aquimonas sp.]|nr:hypothetical protein [Aquimonas sp.]